MTDELNMPAQLRKFSKKNNAKKKPKPLKKNVLHPLLITISVVNLIMIIFFNVVFMLTLYSGVISDLRSITRMMEQITSTNDTVPAYEIAEIYKTELEKHSVSYFSNIVMINDNGNIVYNLYDFQREDAEYIKNGLLDAYEKNKDAKTFNFKTDDDVLTIAPLNLKCSENYRIFIYASLRSLWSSIKWGNEALLVIICFSVLAFVIAAHIIARNISKPIKELSDSMAVVGDGNFAPLEISESSAEIQNLTMSINEMLARLQAYHDVHTRSIQNLSHDLKTPLMSISGFAEGIKYGVFDNTDEATDVIIKESKRLTEVVEKMLILSDLDTLHMQINMISIELNSFLDEEAKLIEGYAMQNDVKIRCSYDRENMKILADTQLLSTIIKNLLSNAVRYAEKNVDIIVFDKDGEIAICVADDGKGLSDEDIENLFVRYYIGKTGHTGLGLSAAKSAAEYMGSRISGQNRNSLAEDDKRYNEKGAVFTVYFPRYE